MSTQRRIIVRNPTGGRCPSCGTSLAHRHPSPPPPERVEESTVRGYRVRTYFRTPKDWKERRATVERVLAQAIVRRARERWGGKEA